MSVLIADRVARLRSGKRKVNDPARFDRIDGFGSFSFDLGQDPVHPFIDRTVE
jgi:hypothetical protein